ncbi:MAG: ATP-dependent Clp protease adapter ClpS [Myxococcota bacterium]|nr:ATP-dependent Clp protease adapter ClpS [Myxococcota bacterium]MDW8364178.1 ATP-dependent Clp protease adapter ClpS [Myxococcales bacterium]MDW8479440.1 ATP-dependent Clp protease adapter ClpS [Xanthomonadales bacterium]
MSRQPRHDLERGGGVLVEPGKVATDRPPMYQVVLLNDDYTPMDFVVMVLELFFGMSRERATRIMLQVHTRGRGVCGVYTREVAETKVAQVNEFARSHQHPLLCTMERA